MNKVILAHAVANENGTANGGEPGDQTGKEVRRQDYYISGDGWENVFRANDPEQAKIIAKTAGDIADNDKIGYSQDKRLTLSVQAQKKNFDCTKIKKKCECDCSSLVAVAVNAAGISVPFDMYTGNEKAMLERTGAFQTLPGNTKFDDLKEGDILHRVGHTAVVCQVISDGKKTYYRVQIVAANNWSTVETYQKLAYERCHLGTGVAEGRQTKWIVYCGDYNTKEYADSVAQILHNGGIPTWTYNVTY